MKAMVPKGPSMNEMLRQAQKMQEEMQAKQAELEEREYDVSAGGGAVKVKINGKREILSIDISPEIVDPDDIETLSDIIVAAVNEAIKKVNSTSDEEMQKITGPLGSMPGLF
ncbi:MAG: YbaB/EbfC family nucleoid-associated protein [Eubacteriales bacterium]